MRAYAQTIGLGAPLNVHSRCRVRRTQSALHPPRRHRESLPGHLKTISHRLTPHEAAPHQVRPSNGVKLALIGHEAHQGINVMAIPCLSKARKKLGIRLNRGELILTQNGSCA